MMEQIIHNKVLYLLLTNEYINIQNPSLEKKRNQYYIESLNIQKMYLKVQETETRS